jgi:hypothetical protein
MADTLITNLANVASPAGTEELAVNVPGSPDTDGKVVLSTLAAYVEGTLGNAAGLDVGTTAGTVAAGDDSRFTDARAPTAHAASHTNGTDDIQNATASVKGLATAAQIAKLDAIEAAADVTDAGNVGSSIDGATAVTTLGDTDKIPVTQSGVLKNIAYSALKTLFNAIYQAVDSTLTTLSGKSTTGSGNIVLSAAPTLTGSVTFESMASNASEGTVSADYILGSLAVSIGDNFGGGNGFALALISGEALTADRALSFSTNDEARNVVLEGDLTKSGSHALSLVTTGATTATLPSGTNTLLASGGALGTPSSGTLTNCTGLPAASLSSFVGLPVEVVLPCSDEATALTTGTSKLTFRMPHAMTVTAVRASVGTAPTGSTLVVDINEGGTSILSTKLSIDATEKTSTTAATPAVISDSALADDAEITIDIDQIGGGDAGAGLKVTLIGTRA